jgi:hypothetical protein
MRFLVAAVLFVAAVVCLILGIGEQTIWRPPTMHHLSLQVPYDKPFIVVEHSALSKFPGNPTITVTGETKVQVAVGRNSDVTAWVGNTPFALITAKDATKSHPLQVTDVPGYEPSANPAGSDLWRAEVSKQKSASIRINVANQAAALISNDGMANAPKDVSLVWKIAKDTTSSNVLILVGTLLLVLAVIMNWRSWYTLRRDRGPRRRTPRAPQGPKLRKRKSQIVAPSKGRRSNRNFAVAVTGLAVAVNLTGCSGFGQNQAASPTPSVAVTKVAPPVVTEAQAKTIIGRVASVVAAGDAGHKVNLLLPRVAGPALNARASHYALQAASNKIKPLPALDLSKFRLILPAATQEWPRTIMAVTSGPTSSDLPNMLVLQQQSPRSQYMLWYFISMLPGVQTPEVPGTAFGAIPVAPNSMFLKISPQALPTAFGDLIDNGQSSIGAQMFNVTNDEFYKQVALSLANQQGNLDNGVIKVAHALGNPTVLSLSTVNSGALVAVYLNDTYTIKPAKKSQAVQVSGDEKLLLGAAGSTTGIRSVYGTMLLFYVPAISSSDKIITLGATQVLISVRSL